MYQIFAMVTVQKKKFSIKDFFSKCDKIRRRLRIWSRLPKKSLMGNLIFCAVRKLTLHLLYPCLTTQNIKRSDQQNCEPHFTRSVVND